MKLNKQLALSLAIVGSLMLSPAIAEQTDEFRSCLSQFPSQTTPTLLKDFPGDREDICYEGFAILYSNESLSPVYTSHFLNAKMLENASRIKQQDQFYSEPMLSLEENLVRSSDFDKSGFNIGQLVPPSNASTKSIRYQSYSLANAVPMNPAVRRGPWTRGLDKSVERYISRSDSNFYIFAGPLYDYEENEEPEKVGDSKIWVPTGFFKLIYDIDNHLAWGYTVDNETRSKLEGVFSYEEMVDITGISFLKGD